MILSGIRESFLQKAMLLWSHDVGMMGEMWSVGDRGMGLRMQRPRDLVIHMSWGVFICVVSLEEDRVGHAWKHRV